MSPSIVAKATLSTFVMWIVWLATNTFVSPEVWAGMQLSKSAITVEYCEFNNPTALFHQSINTYSNLAYFFFGMLIILTAINDRKNNYPNNNFLSKFTSLSLLVGFCMVYLSFGSAFFHASLTWVGQRVDMNGTYGITLLLVAVGLAHLFTKQLENTQLQLAVIISLIILLIAFYEIALHVSSGKLIPVLILASLLLMLIEYFRYKRKKSFLLILFSFFLIVIAIKIRTWDVQKIGCDPYSFFQGHSVWHFLTATSSFVTYYFYKFDKSVT